MKKKRNGYTLIEVIVCVLLIAIIGTVFTVTLNKKKDNDDTTKEQKEEEIFREAIDVLSSNAITAGEFSTYTSTDIDESNYDDIYTFFCLSKNRIIKEGLLPENNEILEGLNDSKYLKVSKNNLGEIKYSKNVSEEECKYYIANLSTINNGGSGDFSTSGDDSYGLKQTFTKKEGVDNQFQVGINFTKELYKEEITPLDVIFVLDISGSMSSNDRAGNAKTAISDFGSEILNIDSSKIGFLPFGTNSCPTNFTNYSGNSLWTTDKEEFKSKVNRVRYDGSTCGGVSNSYNKAYDDIINRYKVEDLHEKDLVYVVLFSDAGNGPTCYTPENSNYVVNRISPYVDKFIFIAYSPGTTCMKDLSVDVNKKYPDKSLYRLSDSSDVNKILTEINNKIQEETQYKDVIISIKINEEFSVVADGDWERGEQINTISQKINFETGEEELERDLEFDILYNPKNLINKSENKDVHIIESIQLLFTKKTGDSENISISQDKLPQTTIITNEKSVIND